MKLPAPKTGMRGEPELLPLINIVFLLLIFFMLTGMFSVQDDAGVRPPESVAQAAAGSGQRLIELTDAGVVRMDGVDIPLAALAGRVDPSVESWQIKADANVDALLLVRVMEILRAADVQRVRLLTAEPQ